MIRLHNASLLLLALAGCHAEPDRACERVRFGWPSFDLDPSVDSSPIEGMQTSFTVRSDLLPGTVANLFVAEGDADQVFASQALTDGEGSLSFVDVSVPLGNITFLLEARDECGTYRSGRRTFVWDGLGIPACSLSLASEPTPEAGVSIPVLGPEHDEDAEQEGMQVRVRVDAGRPDMQVTLFVVDRETSETQSFDLETAANSRAVQTVTLGPGEQAMRAVCYWPPEDLRRNSPTWAYYVDVE